MHNIILTTLRAAKRIPQKEIATLLKMSQANYSDLETGKTKINYDIALKLAKIFDVSPEVFNTEKAMVFNNNSGANSKSIHNFENYNENDKEILQQLVIKMDSFFTIMQQVLEEIKKKK